MKRNKSQFKKTVVDAKNNENIYISSSKYVYAANKGKQKGKKILIDITGIELRRYALYHEYMLKHLKLMWPIAFYILH